MTTTTDPIWAFRDALSPAARHHYTNVSAYDAMPLVRAACERLRPADLARIVGKGIGWKVPANAAGLILHRLRREAGQLEQEGN